MAIEFDKTTRTYTLDAPDAEVEAVLDVRYERIGPLQWQLPIFPALGDVTAFVTAVASGKVDEATYQRRLESCQTCPVVDRDGDKLFCGACRCGRRSIALLDGKLWWSNLPCPLRRPGFPNAKESTNGD